MTTEVSNDGWFWEKFLACFNLMIVRQPAGESIKYFGAVDLPLKQWLPLEKPLGLNCWRS